jgi:hypothetical protein
MLPIRRLPKTDIASSHVNRFVINVPVKRKKIASTDNNNNNNLRFRNNCEVTEMVLQGW